LCAHTSLIGQKNNVRIWGIILPKTWPKLIEGRCRVEWAIKWCRKIFCNRFLTRAFDQNTRQTKLYLVLENTLLGHFLSYNKVKKKCHKHSSVEKVKLYRLVYNSVSRQYSTLAISSCETFETMLRIGVPYWNDLLFSLIYDEKLLENLCNRYWKKYTDKIYLLIQTTRDLRSYFWEMSQMVRR